jgi:hypothetical protein
LLKNLQQKTQGNRKIHIGKQHEEDEDSRRPLIFSVAWDKKKLKTSPAEGAA